MNTTAAAAALMAVVLPSVLTAQIPPGEGQGEAYLPHPEANEAIGQLRSPYCPGLMLEVCPSPDAAILRDSIEMLAQEGWESQQLVEWMIANHGEEWRAIPKTRGTGILAWILPPAALMMGLGVDGVFVGSGIFKSSNPAEYAKSIVEATTFWNEPEVVAKVSRGLGSAMPGIEMEKLDESEKLAGRGW